MAFDLHLNPGFNPAFFSIFVHKTADQWTMKGKVEPFITTFIAYCIITLIWHGWDLDNKQIAEMIFIGILSGLSFALVNKPLLRLIQHLVKKIVR